LFVALQDQPDYRQNGTMLLAGHAVAAVPNGDASKRPGLLPRLAGVDSFQAM
jgi:hypothetical protein